MGARSSADTVDVVTRPDISMPSRQVARRNPLPDVTSRKTGRSDGGRPTFIEYAITLTCQHSAGRHDACLRQYPMRSIPKRLEAGAPITWPASSPPPPTACEDNRFASLVDPVRPPTFHRHGVVRGVSQMRERARPQSFRTDLQGD